MAPPKAPWHTIDRTDEWQKFIDDLNQFHLDRGTKLDPEPKVQQVPVDLLKLYKYVIDKGGYDVLAVEKNIWLSVAQELGIGVKTGVAFNLKTAYYKNLAAYEIQNHWKETPPPPEILEKTSAAGGNLRSRTLENFKHKLGSVKGDSPMASGDDGTPARDTKPDEETPSSSRAARGLRSAPPQRVIFQPDTGSSRPSSHRQASGHQHSNTSNIHSHDHSQSNTPSKPDPHANSQSNGYGQPHALNRSSSHQMNYGSPAQAPQPHMSRGGASASFTPQNYDNQSSTVTAYQPPAVQPLALRPVETPANAPAKFARRFPVAPPPAAPRQAPLPGSKFLAGRLGTGFSY